ncbi:TonB-dependent receptor [Phenylobacterium sp.]|uniref:TonB-dependent receptor n=1 Tax=Phenylobacterium sp. TaxID=1871053 RepID=UPI0028A1155C|nr:TonB-dependent receptor [Phenylobacterium sp.]
MNRMLRRALGATTALAGVLAAGVAMAQSTGTATVEEFVVTGALGPANQAGVIVAEREPKSRASVTQEFLSTQTPGQTVLQSLNLLPAVNFTNNDPFGSAGGDITIRGFDSQRVALLQDGVPLNDSGNYAIYPNQQLDSDLIDRATVNLGTTDVDSPTAAAAGGTINYVTRRAADEFGVRAELGFGSDNFQRYYATVETGRFGPWGTKAWFSALYTKNDMFKPHDAVADPAGQIEKTQYNARIDQDFGEIGWASLIFNYNENRNNFINRVNLANYTAGRVPVYTDDVPCSNLAGGPGAQVQSCASTWAPFNINPSNTGNIRGLSSWSLSDSLTLTVDPSFQYVLANGGGAQLFPENDLQLIGNSGAAGVDLNGDGDLLDRVYLYRPNTTNTRRYGVTSSLIWKFADNQSVRLAYTYDKAKHRQTGDFGYLDANGVPEDVFAGKDGRGRPVLLPDGSNGRRRDRSSVAYLNQFAVEYRGRFVDDKLLFNAGLRVPYFERELTNFCYQQNTFNAYCTTQIPRIVPGTDDGTGRPLVTFPQATLNSSASLLYGQPRSFNRKYDDVLPNLGVSYDFTENLTVFASYAETLSAPRTDDLYDQILVDPGPESAKTVDLGLRYNNGPVMLAASVWRNDFSNRIERVFDEPAGIAFSANVGDVKLWGIDGQVGFKPSEDLSFYASASYIESEIQDDIPGTGSAAPLPTKGKSLYETPKLQGGVRVAWDPVEDLRLGVQGKFVGDRWTNLVNTEKFPGYALWDLDVRWKLDRLGLEGTYLQANVQNLFDERYIGDIATNLTGTALGQPGYRRTFILTLHAEF